jgi:hypothetical protein
VEYRVSDVCQTASGGSYVVKYHAEVQAAPGDGTAIIEVVSTIPEALEFIRRGAESVLQPRGLRARLRLHRLAIHDVDCRPHRYENATAKALAHVLDRAATA